MSQNVEHPAHYNMGGVECIDAIKAALGPERYEGFLAGNVIKYIWRYPHKGGAEDVGKASFYLDLLQAELAERKGLHEADI